MAQHNRKIAVVGLGTVGLTLIIGLAKHGAVVGFDNDPSRVEDLNNHYDRNRAFSKAELTLPNVELSADPAILDSADFFIVAVPTPIDHHNEPDLNPLVNASKIIGRHLKQGDIVVYESTDYPGTTEQVCIPQLEKVSKLKSNHDFSVGYSPERINPGDKQHTMENIVKLIAAQNETALEIIGSVYRTIIKAGVHPVSSIKVAEASKVIENIQRDVNIALVNEIAMIMHKMDINTQEVLEAASTKWSFHCYAPGLVGGDCIGVDPYYLIFRSSQLGYMPEIISASRRINSMMGKFIAESAVKELAKMGKAIVGSKIAIMGFTFKENYPEEKNTRVIDIINELDKYKVIITVADPIVNKDLVKKHYSIDLVPMENISDMDAIIFAVGHDQFKHLTEARIKKMLKQGKGLVVDVKGIMKNKHFDDGITVWML